MVAPGSPAGRRRDALPRWHQMPSTEAGQARSLRVSAGNEHRQPGRQVGLNSDRRRPDQHAFRLVQPERQGYRTAPGFGPVSAKNLVAGIEGSKAPTFRGSFSRWGSRVSARPPAKLWRRSSGPGQHSAQRHTRNCWPPRMLETVPPPTSPDSSRIQHSVLRRIA